VGVLPVDSHWHAPTEALVCSPLVPQIKLATLLVHRRNRSLRPNAAAAWAQFSALSETQPHERTLVSTV
jgi:hypothetical protein